MEKTVYWILGAGRFGRLAVERLLARRRPPHLVVVDRDLAKLRSLAEERAELVHREIIEFLVANLGKEPDWIIPAAPIHVAFAWLSRGLAERGDVEILPVPEAVDAQVPNPWRDGKGGLYTSVARFHCPDNCSEPRDRCTTTGLPRAGDLFSLLAKVGVPGYTPLVVRSHQLAPGVGGYRPSALRRLMARADAATGPMLVVTACRCHGVIHAFRWHRAEGSRQQAAGSGHRAWGDAGTRRRGDTETCLRRGRGRQAQRRGESGERWGRAAGKRRPFEVGVETGHFPVVQGRDRRARSRLTPVGDIGILQKYLGS